MIQDDFNYFELLKSKGISSEKAYLEAKKQPLNYFSCIRMLRSVYHLSLSEAKKVTILADNRTQNVDESPSRILEQHQHNLVKILHLATTLKMWDFHQDNQGKWHWTTYQAPNGEIKVVSSVEGYSRLLTCFSQAQEKGYRGGIITEQELSDIRQIFNHNKNCSPNEVIYEHGDWYDYNAEEGRFEKIDTDSNVFEIDSNGVLTYLGKSWELAEQSALFSTSVDTKKSRTLELSQTLETQLNAIATYS